MHHEPFSFNQQVLTMKIETQSSDSPYRTDPFRTANEAYAIATETKNQLMDLSKRLKILEKQERQQYGFLRTNWNGFWGYVRKVFDFILSTEFFLFCGFVTVILAMIFAIYDSNKSSDNDARVACGRANMSLLNNGNSSIICLREDGAVLTIRGGLAPTLTLPASAEQASE
jgi:hypothetical protein